MTTYDLTVIGGGAAGLVVAIAGATLGKKTLLIEKNLLGGDCTHYGCVPSKTLLHEAKIMHQLQQAYKEGRIKSKPKNDWKKISKKVKQVVDKIYATETPEKLEEQGVKVIKGHAKFTGPTTIDVGGKKYTSKKFVISTGGRPRMPRFSGSDKIKLETNETIFYLKEQPKHLAIIGGGPIGCEMAQAFARLGSKVTIIERGEILSREEKRAREMLLESLENDGVTILSKTTIKKATTEKKQTILHTSNGKIQADTVLAAIGRIPNTENLQLEKAGVEVDDRGRINTDEKLRTTQAHIYAAGDCTSKYQFTHVAEEHARAIINNAILPVISKKFTAKYIPWVTFTDPEIAHVGQTEGQLMGQRFETLEWEFDENDRARTESNTQGYVKIYITPLRGKILGATIVGESAGEMIATICLAMQQNLSARHLSNTLMPYPTRAQSIRWAADKYFRDIISQKLKDVLE